VGTDGVLVLDPGLGVGVGVAVVQVPDSVCVSVCAIVADRERDTEGVQVGVEDVDCEVLIVSEKVSVRLCDGTEQVGVCETVLEAQLRLNVTVACHVALVVGERDMLVAVDVMLLDTDAEPIVREKERLRVPVLENVFVGTPVALWVKVGVQEPGETVGLGLGCEKVVLAEAETVGEKVV